MKILPCGVAVLAGDTHASKWIEEHGRIEYDAAVQKDIVPLLNQGDTVLDVGALYGSYAYEFKKAVGPKGHVFAFEPNPHAFKCLKHNCPDVGCFNVALGDKECLCRIEKSKKYPENCGASCVVPDETGTVQMVALDSFWRFHEMDIKFIKVDIEGYEPEFIKGALRTINSCRPIIFIEINHDVLSNRGHKWHHVIDPLTAIGYKPKFLSKNHNFIEDQWPQIDLLMMP